MKGYKAFDKNLQCKGMQFKVGNEFKIKGDLELCKNGFHFCEKFKDVFDYYPKNEETRVCEVLATGLVITEGNKSCTSSIKILRELNKEEIKQMTDSFRFNSGDNNSGHYNSGNYNSGHYNSGSYNSGNSNSGYYNSGDNNSGYYNSGNYNSGHYNSGDNNSGHYNSGDNNSGHYNSGNYNSGNSNSGDNNSGYFNTTSSKVRLFNKDTDLDFSDLRLTPMINTISQKMKPHLIYVYSKDMTEQEKLDNPSHVTTGGFLRKNSDSYKKAWVNMWNTLNDTEKSYFTTLPNFDAKIFFEITGIDLDDKVEVTVNGVVKHIKKEDAVKLGLV